MRADPNMSNAPVAAKPASSGASKTASLDRFLYRMQLVLAFGLVAASAANALLPSVLASRLEQLIAFGTSLIAALVLIVVGLF